MNLISQRCNSSAHRDGAGRDGDSHALHSKHSHLNFWKPSSDMKFALLLLSTSLNLSIAADATRAVTARALETAEEKKAAADVVKALDLNDVVHSVTVAGTLR